MLDQLLACTSSDDLINIGADLTSSDAMFNLQCDIVKNNIVFDSSEYWESDKFEIYEISELFDVISKETVANKTLHLFQLLKMFCPAIVVSIDKLLSKTTR